MPREDKLIIVPRLLFSPNIPLGARWNFWNPMKKRVSITLLVTAMLCSCSTKDLLITGVQYQSIRTEFAQPTKIPDDAKIAVEFFFNQQGEMQPVVYNLTDEILSIDQTKSFVIMPDGISLSYYDPNTYSTTNGTYSSQTESLSFDLGAVTRLLGLGGPLGALAAGTTLRTTNTNGSFSFNTVTRVDQPTVNVGPRGCIAMSKVYSIKGIGWDSGNYNSFTDISPKMSAIRFSVCITYSVGDNQSFDKLVTNFYVSSNMNEKTDMKNVSKAFNKIYFNKPDALAENMYMFLIHNNIESHYKLGEFIIHSDINDSYIRGSLVDFQ